MAGVVAAQALVVVDVQRGWVVGPHAVAGADVLLERLDAALAAARDAGALVVQVQDVGEADSTVPVGSPGRELALAVLGGEAVVQKTADDAFVGTDLEAVLRDAAVREVVIGGLQSEMCVAATVRGALSRGFRVVLPRDAHATYDIPARGTGVAVPAGHVRRVAEWSLGDEVVVVDTVGEVTFEPPPRTSTAS